MKDILEKLSSYNIFNYLLPGTVFVFVLDKISNHNLIQKDLLIGVFLYYFIGLIISRIGSVLIEPILKKIKFLKFADYTDFVVYSKEDSKIEVLSETNNMYRTIVSLMISLLFVKISDCILKWTGVNQEIIEIIIIILVLCLFIFSYRKQTNYIAKRIEANKNKNGTQQKI